MYFSKFDFISSKITLFYKGSYRHRNIISASLTIVSAILVILLLVLLFIEFIEREPQAFYFNRFVDDAGIIPLSKSSFLHYYYAMDISSFPYYYLPADEFLKYFRAVGKSSENSKVAWVYAKCTEDDFGDLIELYDSIEANLCIKYMWDYTSNKFYKKGDSEFFYPSLLHGMNHPNFTTYDSYMYLCDDTSLDFDTKEILGGCEDINKIKERTPHIVGSFGMIDHYVEVKYYDEPIRNVPYVVQGKLHLGSYTSNNININPALIRTDVGVIRRDYKEKTTYIFEQNRKVEIETDGNLVSTYSVYLQNRQQVYDRTYKKFHEILANAGGLVNVIILIIKMLNYFITDYTRLNDCFIDSLDYMSNLDLKNEKMVRDKSKNILGEELKGLSNVIKGEEKKDEPLRKIYVGKRNTTYPKPKKELKLINQIEETKEGKNPNNTDQILNIDLSNENFIQKSEIDCHRNIIKRNRLTLINERPLQREVARSASDMSVVRPYKSHFKPKTIYKINLLEYVASSDINFSLSTYFNSYICICCRNNKKNKRNHAVFQYLLKLMQSIISEEALFDLHYFLKEFLGLDK